MADEDLQLQLRNLREASQHRIKARRSTLDSDELMPLPALNEVSPALAKREVREDVIFVLDLIPF
jgi:hypothetical protein